MRATDTLGRQAQAALGAGETTRAPLQAPGLPRGGGGVVPGASEVRLDLDPLQVRGAWLLQSNVLAARQQVERAIATLDAAEADAAKTLGGRLPEGVDLLRVRFDQATGEAWAPAALQTMLQALPPAMRMAPDAGKAQS